MTIRPLLSGVLLRASLGASAQSPVTNARVVPSQVQPN